MPRFRGADRMEQLWADQLDADRPGDPQGTKYGSFETANPLVGIGLWDYFVQWWDATGSHRITCASRAEAEKRADEIRASLCKRWRR